MSEYDVVVIGTGTAGQTAALALAGYGLRTAIADFDEPGGTCALRGCQPKKFLVVPAHAAIEGSALVERGFRQAPTLDWTTMQRSRAEFTDAVPDGTRRSLADAGIVLLGERAHLVPDGSLIVGGQTLKPERVLIATGAHPVQPVIPGSEHAVTSTDFLELEAMPERVVFLGGGYVSMEFGTVAAAAGAQVTIVQRGLRVMERFDRDLVAALQGHCAAQDMEICTNATASSIEKHEDGSYLVTLDDGRSVEGDLVVAAVGRAPMLDGLGLDDAGVEFGRRGITVDARMRTTSPRVYAIGDCAATIQLAPVADAEARVAAAAIAEDLGCEVAQPQPIDYGLVPSVVFTYPQLAGFGMSADEAEDHENVRVASGSGAGWPSYRRLNESAVHFKVMIDTTRDTIVGAHILAPQAGELINLLVLAARSGVTATQFRHMTWAYPTYTSDLKYMLG